jgi:hypothetical protein
VPRRVVELFFRCHRIQLAEAFLRKCPSLPAWPCNLGKVKAYVIMKLEIWCESAVESEFLGLALITHLTYVYIGVRYGQKMLIEVRKETSFGR